MKKKIGQIEMMPFCEDKNKLTEDLFHISFWSLMDMDQKIRTLQLLENNLSFIEGRTPSRVVKVFLLPNMASSSYLTRKIRISQWHLENGLTYLKDMNAQMYCAILHEHEHMNQFADVDDNEKTELFRNNITNMVPYGAKSVSEYVEYRFQPIEYYAHYVSEEGTKKVFKRLEQEFGNDQGFEKWLDVISSASVDNLIELYNSENMSNYSFN